MNDITRETKGQAKRKNSEWQEPVTSPTQTLTQGGHEIASLLNKNEQKFSFLHMMKHTRINWENEIKHPIKGRLPDEF